MTTPESAGNAAGTASALAAVISARALAVVRSWEADPDERWLPVVGYEGLYEVSDQGRVKSLVRTVTRRNGRSQTVPEVILTPQMRGNPWRRYPAVRLSHLGKTRHHPVHQLVLEAFVGPRPDGMEACHANDIATDNRLSNLRWDSHTANELDKIRNGKRKALTVISRW